MNHGQLITTLILVLALGALAPGALRADDEGDANELVVFGGISLLDASRSSETTFDLGSQLPDFGGMPGRGGAPGRPGFPNVSVPVTLGGETSLGSAPLFGARYSRRIKDRLFVEADLQLAPGHELESEVSGCVAGVCVGRGEQAPGGRGSVRGGGRAFDLGFGGGNVNAWHYGAGLAYEITGGDVRPLVLLGAGGVSYDGARGADTSFALRFGLGLKVLFGRVGARVDVVDHLVLDHFASGDTEHDVHATAGLLVRF